VIWRARCSAFFFLLPLLLAACEPQSAGQSEALGELEHLTAPAGRWTSEPDLAVGPDGAVHLTWLETRADSSRQLRFSVLQGDAWSQPRVIATGSDWFISAADIPSLLPLPDGRLAAQYLQRDGRPGATFSYGIRLLHSSDGGGSWSRSAAPHRDTIAAEHGFASLFPVGGDSAGIVWLDGRDLQRPDSAGATALRYSAMAPDGALGPEVVLDGRVCDCCQTAVALTAHGPVVAYRGRTEGEIRDILLARRVEGQWLAGRPVREDGWKIQACPVNGPGVAADGESVAVAWYTAARDTPRVLVAFSQDAGANFGEAVRVDGGNPAGRVGIVLVAGGALVSWVERTDGGSAEVQARLVTPGGHLGNPILISHATGERAAGFPKMVRSGDHVIFAWTRAEAKPMVQTARLHLGENR
jgi:hypothetical protein